MIRSIILAFAIAWLAPFPAAAGDAALQTRQALESGHLATGDQDMSTRLAADPSDNEARFGLGMIRFAEAIENFGQRQYRYGLRAPPNTMFPFFRLPVPLNPAPEELTYEKQRESLQALLDDLTKVEATLAPMTASETKIVIDLNAVQFDFRGDGKADSSETLGSILAAMRSHGVRPAPNETGPFEVKFDNSDAFWLRGYCHLLSASLEFVLAYDWRSTFERTAGLFYPRVAPPPFGPNPHFASRREELPVRLRSDRGFHRLDPRDTLALDRACAFASGAWTSQAGRGDEPGQLADQSSPRPPTTENGYRARSKRMGS